MLALLLVLFNLIFILVLSTSFILSCASGLNKPQLVYSALRSSNHFVVSQYMLALFGISINILHHSFKIPEPVPVNQ